MSEQPKPTLETQSAIGGVNSLGAVTERVFKRLYRGLNRRASEQSVSAPTAAAPSTPVRPTNLPEARADRDVERQAKLREALGRREQEIARLNGILSTLNDGIVMQDTDGRIVLINAAAQELLGSQKNFWQSELGTLFESSRSVVKLDSELTPLGEPQRLQLNNRVIGAQMAAVADISGKQLGTMMVLRDVTEDAIFNRLKDQFATAISHELRTPMAVIKGVGEVLTAQGEKDGGVPANNRRLLDTLSRNVDTLDRMVVELLDISEMGAGSFVVRQDEVLLEPLVWSVVNGMATEIKRAKLDYTFMVRDETQLKIAGDEQRLRWAFGHVLQNALRYTEPGGHLEIRLGVQSRRANTIAIHFIDTGVGISAKDLPHVFERFYRGEPSTASGKLLDPRGLGQGLFIARTVAEAHGGMITVRSQPGRGSTFTMLLPALNAAPNLTQGNH
jgi:signal transduction histidine kinase